MVRTRHVQVSTRGNGDMVDLTPQVREAVGGSDAKAGVATVFVAGSTAGVTTIEFERGLREDFPAMMERLAPRGIRYGHEAYAGDDNGHSHVRASLLGPSLAVPFGDGRLMLGTWQQIVLVDFDTRPRTRDIVVQIVGE